MKTLAVHLHLYYLDQLSEILKYFDSLKGIDYDLFITMVKEDSQAQQQIKSFNKNAKIWIVPNRGYDVGPFIEFLHKINLNDYRYILKIHTKENRNKNITYLNKHGLDNKLWRQILLDALLKNSNRVRKNLSQLNKNKDIGMLSSKYCLTADEENYLKLLPAINKELKKLGLEKVQTLQFIAGTMFYAKASLLKPFLQYNLEDFSKTDGRIKDGTLAHVLERLFSIIIEKQGLKIYGIEHDNYKWNFYKNEILYSYIAPFKRFIFQKKRTLHGNLIIKILKLPIYHKWIGTTFGTKIKPENKVRFSVIMPTYNRAFCIEKAINSLLKQTYSEYELIIIDDGSNDNTEQLLKEKYSRYFKSNKFIYKKVIKNKGVCYARNLGLKTANNNWIVYLDSDNMLKRNFLKTFKKAIQSNPKNKCFYAKRDEQTGMEFNYDTLCQGNYIDLGVFAHAKSLIKKYGLFDTNLKRLVDWDLIIRYTKEEKPFFIDKVLIKYSNSGDYPRITNTEDLAIAQQYIQTKIEMAQK